jgi:hypothetical protein
MGIVGYEVVLRSPEDFADDAERRQWLESPHGQQWLAMRWEHVDRRHRAAIIVSSAYRQQQQVIEDALKGISGDFAGDIMSAEDAIRAHIRSQQA